MARTACKTVFKFDELSDSAKEKAREWFRNDGGDSFMFAAEYIFEDAATVADLMGIDLRQRYVPLMNGKTRAEPSIYFSLDRDYFCSFEAHYQYKKGAVKAVKSCAPQDEKLHSIAQRLQDEQKRHFYKLLASCSHGRESMRVEVEHAEDSYRDIDGDGITECLTDFAHWILKRLEAEYEYVYSDECVDESMSANEYEFTEDGEFYH